jgi:RNA polymerase sigma-70 factor, ECF subfamily
VLRSPRRSRKAQQDYGDLADEDLMVMVGGGEPRALEVIFDRHGSAAFSLAYRMCGRRPMAEDVVQEAFMSLWRTGGGYDRTRGSVRSWVLSVVRHRAIDAFRRERRSNRNVSDDGVAEWLVEPTQTEVEVERHDEAEHVREAVRELPSDQRRVIELAYFGGLTHTEIADMLELPVGTVKGRMRLGLTKLRISLTSTDEARL